MAINVPIITTFADKGVNAAEKAFGNLSKSTVIAGAAIGAAVTAVAAFAYSSIQKASDFNEAISKNTVVFGAISKEVENFAQTANRALGLSETAALKAAGTFATFGKSAGLAGKDLSDFSTNLVTMAADLASFNNTSVDEAINALGSALRGEAEPLRKYGVLLDDATLKAAATELGIYSGNKALTAQQKVLAAQKVIFDQTADAQGDFSRTSTGLAAQQKILGATLENIQTNLGQAFLPIFLKAVKFFNDEVTPAFERVAEVIGEKGLVKGMQQALYEMGSFGPGMVEGFKQVAVNAAKAANALYKFAVVAGSGLAFAAGKYATGIQLLGKAFDDLIDVDALGASFDKFALGIKNMGSASDYSSFAAKQLAENAKAATTATDGLSGVTSGKGATAAADKLNKMQKAAKEAAETLAKETAEAVKTAANELDTRLKQALDTAKTNLTDAQTAFGNFGKSVSDGLTSAFSFADAKTFGDETGTSFITGLSQQIQGIEQYAADVQTLLGRGLSQESLAAVLAAGGTSGAAIARELVEGAQENITGPQGVNAFVTTLNDFATTVGLNAANKWYGAGVSNAQSYLDGIQSAFDFAQTKLATPSLNVADIIEIGAGFDMGISEPVLAPISKPEAGYGGPGPGVTVNVTGGISTSAEIGEAVVNAIRAYNRTAGPADITVTR